MFYRNVLFTGRGAIHLPLQGDDLIAVFSLPFARGDRGTEVVHPNASSQTGSQSPPNWTALDTGPHPAALWACTVTDQFGTSLMLK